MNTKAAKMDNRTGRLQGKVALITGAGSGIGEAAALKFAREGARVALVGRTLDKLEAVAEAIRRSGGDAIGIQADVADEAQADAAVARTLEAFGRFDIAFNNAGVLGTQAPIAQMDVADFDAIIATNLRGVWLVARAAIRAMLAAGTRGVIINTSSFVAQAPNAGSSAYAASKAGIDAMTRALALEVGPQGIRVNNLAPGVVETPMFTGAGVPDTLRQALAGHAALKRLGRPEDLANAAAWLASSEAAFVTGQTILIDGGFTIPGLR